MLMESCQSLDTQLNRTADFVGSFERISMSMSWGSFSDVNLDLDLDIAMVFLPQFFEPAMIQTSDGGPLQHDK